MENIMTINKDKYVIVNLWTSKENKALTGVNCGHASLTVVDGTNETYISLWPGARKQHQFKTTFFQDAESVVKSQFSNFDERPTSYKMDYEQDCVLEAYCEHNYRDIKVTSDCEDDEVVYRVNNSTGTFVRVNEQPRAIKPEEKLCAMKLLPANFRMVLYSLDVDKILAEFNRLRDPEYITGWSMAGSNFITRNINFSDKTSENCASLVYRCLNAGGLFSRVSSKLSLQPSSAVSPDDLLRIIVAAKENELDLYTGDRVDWLVADVKESSWYALQEAYNEVGQNANAENDLFPSIKPSVGGCTIF